MDVATRELDRIVSLASRIYPSIDWNSCRNVPETSSTELDNTTPCAKRSNHSQQHSSDNVVDYFHLDNLGINEWGDTALHRLVALHAPPEAVQLFLDRMKEAKKDVLSLDQTNNEGATALHVAVYKNSWYADEIIKILIDRKNNVKSNANNNDEISLASIPMKCGSYPLHVLCGNNLTIRRESLSILLEEDPSIVMKEDVNGDNPLSLLWKNVLRFRWAASFEQGKEDILHIDEGLAWMTVITPGKYVDFSLLLLKAARKVDRKNAPEDAHNGRITLHEMCAMHRCPPLLVRLALSNSQFCKRIMPIAGNVYTADCEGMLPIHHAARAAEATTAFVPPYVGQYLPTVFELLLQAHPASATIADNYGRLPLHYALESGHVQERGLLSLLHANPDALRVKDPVSGLYPFMLVAASTAETFQTAPQKHPTWIDEDETGNLDGFDGGQGENIDVNYVILRLCPEAVHFDQRCRSIYQ